MHAFIKVNLLFTIFMTSAAIADVKNLCNVNERTLWSCQTSKKTYSLCASNNLTGSEGYLQYRAGAKKNIEFKFPENQMHPKGNFEFNLLPHGVSLSFKNGNYTYSIYEDVKGEAAINVEKESKTIAVVKCRESTDTLTENSSIDIFKAAGIAE